MFNGWTNNTDEFYNKMDLNNPFQFIYVYNENKIQFKKYYNNYLWENLDAKNLYINIYDNYDDICKIKNKEITYENLNIDKDIKCLIYLQVDIHYYTHDNWCNDPLNNRIYTKQTKYILFNIPDFLKDDKGDIKYELFNIINNTLYKECLTYKLKINKNTKHLFNRWVSDTSKPDTINCHDYCDQMEEYEPINYYLIKL